MLAYNQRDSPSAQRTLKTVVATAVSHKEPLNTSPTVPESRYSVQDLSGLVTIATVILTQGALESSSTVPESQYYQRYIDG